MSSTALIDFFNSYPLISILITLITIIVLILLIRFFGRIEPVGVP